MRTQLPLPAVLVSLALQASLAALSVRAAESGPAPATPGGPLPRGAWSLRQTPVVDVVKRVKESVVNIHSERSVQAPALDELFSHSPSQNRVNGMGTGIVIDPRGYVVTNQHVVEDVSLIRVRLADGTTLGARVIARDPESDLAILKINPPRPLPVMPLGTSRDLMVGETVVAVGNAYGYDHTVTVGVVSAIGRDVTLNKEVRYRSLIQTDASINPGNSGGPLLNIHGELIGVNVAIRAGAQGIGFAIPVDTMVRVGAELLGRTRQRQGASPLGLVLEDRVRVGADAPLRSAVISHVEADGPAARAGLKAGDVLVKAGDTAIASGLDLQRALLDRDGGERVRVVVKRGKDERRLELTLDGGRVGHTASPVSRAAEAGAEDQVWRKLGLRVEPVPAERVNRTHPQLHGGLAVTDVRPESTAAKAGLRNGDVVVGLHQWEMLSLDNVLYVLNHAERATFQPLRFYILRAGQVHRGWLSPEE
jgi:serine protease Do